MANFTNLPGIEVNIADGGLILPEDTSTQSLLILAPSLVADAPGQPVLIRQSSDLVTFGFGTFVMNGEVNPIAAAWKAAFDAGNRRTYLMAVKGKDSKEQFANLQDALFGILADFTVDHVVLHGIFVDSEVADIKVEDLPEIEGIENFPNVPGIVHYAEMLHADAVLSAPIKVELDKTDKIVFSEGGVDRTATLAAVTYDGQNKKIEDFLADIKSALAAATPAGTAKLDVILVDGVLTIVSDKPITLKAETTAPLGIKPGVSKREKHDTGTIHVGNFAQLLADYAEVQTLTHNAVLTYIGTSAPVDNSLANVKRHVDKLAKLDNEYSGYVSVVACPEFGYNLPGKSSLHYMSSAVSYAGLTSTLRAESAPTNKRVPGVASIHYNLSLRQLNLLTGQKYVTFRLRNNQVVCTDGITTAPDYFVDGVKRTSDYSRLSTLRITQAATELVRTVCEPFIGEPNDFPRFNSLNATIKGGLEAMKTEGAIRDYRFTVLRRGNSLSECVVTLEIIPAFEMRKIQVNVSLRPNF